MPTLVYCVTGPEKSIPEPDPNNGKITNLDSATLVRKLIYCVAKTSVSRSGSRV
jgi:hypothetical protein